MAVEPKIDQLLKGQAKQATLDNQQSIFDLLHAIIDRLDTLARAVALTLDLAAFKADMDARLDRVEAVVVEILADLEGPPVLPIVGIFPVSNSDMRGRFSVATKAKLTKVLKGNQAKAAASSPMAAAPPTSGNFAILDSGQGFTVMGTDAGGNLVPLPSTFSIAVTSDTPANVSVGAITGATFQLNNPEPTPPPAIGSTAKVTLTATDSATPPTPGSPFTFDMLCTVQAGNIVAISPVANP